MEYIFENTFLQIEMEVKAAIDGHKLLNVGGTEQFRTSVPAGSGQKGKQGDLRGDSGVGGDLGQ